MTERDADAAFERYRIVLEMWARENPIKTVKLQWLLGVNAFLIAAAGVTAGGLTHEKWPVYLGGAAVCAVWTLSIGRTTLFQAGWSRTLDELAASFPDDERFHLHETKAARAHAPRSVRVLGGVSSTWYLIFTPVVFGVTWLVLLVVTLAKRA